MRILKKRLTRNVGFLLFLFIFQLSINCIYELEKDITNPMEYPKDASFLSYSEDFSSYSDGIIPSSWNLLSGNVENSGVVTLANGNKVFRYDDSYGSGTPVFQIPIYSYSYMRECIIEFDATPSDDFHAWNNIALLDTNGNIAAFFAFRDYWEGYDHQIILNNIALPANTFARTTPQTYYHFRMVINFYFDRWSAWIDGEQVVNNLDYPYNNNPTGINQIIFNGGYNQWGNAYYDNFTYYVSNDGAGMQNIFWDFSYRPDGYIPPNWNLLSGDAGSSGVVTVGDRKMFKLDDSYGANTPVYEIPFQLPMMDQINRKWDIVFTISMSPSDDWDSWNNIAMKDSYGNLGAYIGFVNYWEGYNHQIIINNVILPIDSFQQTTPTRIYSFRIDISLELGLWKASVFENGYILHEIPIQSYPYSTNCLYDRLILSGGYNQEGNSLYDDIYVKSI